jgi:hypothetical protein
MSLLNDDFKKKIIEIKKNQDLSSDYFYKVKLFKKHLDDFNLINKVSDDFFISIYRKNFNEILEYEIENKFQYSKKDILGIETKIKHLSSHGVKKYTKFLDYFIIKISDLNSPLYGTLINFISYVFDDLNYTLEICEKIRDIWEKEFSEDFLDFKDFEKSPYFESILNDFIFFKKDNYFNLKNESDIFQFLIFCSETSDFCLEGFDQDNDTINNYLFDNNKDQYKKYGQKILFDIKNKVISYN